MISDRGCEDLADEIVWTGLSLFGHPRQRLLELLRDENATANFRLAVIDRHDASLLPTSPDIHPHRSSWRMRVR